ncbi:DUF3515 family protein [Micromonospora sp. CPCC 205711]|uniref:DUF3515 family protein n=1 Tax=Micromonospora sp. CPCC 205547 TaxID=3122400 RepID=UPI002FF26779
MDEKTSTPAPDAATASARRPGKASGWDRSTRRAALVATLVAVPVTVAVAAVAFAKLAPDSPSAAPNPTVTSARPQATGPVEMAAPALAARPATVCRALVSQLPDTIRDLGQRPVSAGPEQNVAYGDPAVTVSCGGASPTVGATDDVWTVNKVCWFAKEETDATVLTTVDRETPVTLRVPRSYGQALQWAPPIADTIIAAVPSGGTAPAGCRA